MRTRKTAGCRISWWTLIASTKPEWKLLWRHQGRGIVNFYTHHRLWELFQCLAENRRNNCRDRAKRLDHQHHSYKVTNHTVTGTETNPLVIALYLKASYGLNHEPEVVFLTIYAYPRRTRKAIRTSNRALTSIPLSIYRWLLVLEISIIWLG